MRRRALLVFLLSLPACGAEPAEPGASSVTPAPPGSPYPSLGEWHLFADLPSQRPSPGVVPYEVNAALWSDAADKHRFIYVPEGQRVGYDPSGDWQFPVGTILVKTFGMRADQRDPDSPERLLETRLLVHEADAWTAHVYVYDESGRHAARKPAGASMTLSYVDVDGAPIETPYTVPNTNQCQECHGPGQALDTLGGRTRQLNRDHDYGAGQVNQIDHFQALGWFSAPPEPAAARQTLPDPRGDAPLEARARAYLDANCGHCHTSGRNASSSGLKLAWGDTDPATRSAAELGVCKVPTSAGGATCGLVWDIVPGQPEESILLCRVESREPKVQMPPLATHRVDAAGSRLLRDWIGAMPEPACQ